ncbi:methyl-viologen-reducing hydrogenase subunit delta, partial [Candidatus Magnetoovum chiemensis]
MYKVFPTKAPFTEIETPAIEKKIQAVKGNSNIKVYTSTTIKSIDGEPGMYKATIETNGSTEDLDFGALVFATGWRPYDAKKLDHLGYGKFKNVVTNIEMEEIAQKGKITRPSDNKEAKNIVFIQCAGQRDPNHIPYCSTVCCNVSLKQAKYVREANPEASAFIIYKDIRTQGHYEYFYRAAQDDEGIFLTKGEVLSIEEGPEGTVLVKINNMLLNENMTLQADLVVLATGMVSQMVPEDRDVNNLTPEYIGNFVTKKTQDGEVVELEPIPLMLNLKYRQGPELPHLKYGFPDSHFI